MLSALGDTWEKSWSGHHDMIMGGYNEAEFAELGGLFRLSNLRNEGIESLLYRDDGLIMTSKSRKQEEGVQNI